LLAKQFRVVRLEMPGFGIAPRGRVSTLAGWAAAVGAVADALGVSRFAVLGHSFGGGAAVLAAAAAGGRARGLVLIASMGARIHRAFARPPGFYGLLRALVRFPLTRPVTVTRARAVYSRLQLPQPADWRELHLHLGLMASVDFAAVGRAAREISAPALVFQAEDDPLVEPEIALELAGLLPSGELILFPDGGHHLQKTRAGKIAEAVTRALTLPVAAPPTARVGGA